jgi:hypothetical protein
MNNCKSCEHIMIPQGGHCYMFREEPQGVCYKHTGRQLGSPQASFDTTADFTESLVDMALSLVQFRPSVSAPTPEVFKAGGGGDFGGGGATGSWELPSVGSMADAVCEAASTAGDAVASAGSCVVEAVTESASAVADVAGDVASAAVDVAFSAFD